MLTSQQYIQQILPQIQEIESKALGSHLSSHSQPHLLIDVREPLEFSQGHIDGAINIPRGVLEMEIERLIPRAELTTKKFFLYCRSGGRSALAAHSLQQMGLNNVYSLKGGYALWQSEQ